MCLQCLLLGKSRWKAYNTYDWLYSLMLSEIHTTNHARLEGHKLWRSLLQSVARTSSKKIPMLKSMWALRTAGDRFGWGEQVLSPATGVVPTCLAGGVCTFKGVWATETVPCSCIKKNNKYWQWTNQSVINLIYVVWIKTSASVILQVNNINAIFQMKMTFQIQF